MKFMLTSLTLAAFAQTGVAFAPSATMPQLSNAGRITQESSHNTSPWGVTHTTTSSPSKRHAALVLCMAKVGIFFGTSTGSTEDVAYMLAEKFGNDKAEGPFDIEECKGKVAEEFAKYDALILGTPTWNTGADTERSGVAWDEIYYGEMQDLKLQGKKVGVFGLGDSESYAENYGDATGELHDVLQNLGCTMMGYTSQEGYEHEDSKAIRGDLFCGLMCDAVNQEELTDGRATNWVQQLLDEGILEGGGGASAPAASVPEIDTIAPPAPSAEVVPSTPEPAIATVAEGAALNDATVDGFTPHFNPRTGSTMWVSQDGRKCFYT